MFREGQKIGDYTLVKKLGRGGFAEVWLAEKRSHFFNKKVAVKLFYDDQIDFETIKQEASLWEEASGHPNVLPIIDAHIYEDQILIVSEYASGGSLSDKLKAQGKLSITEAVKMTIGILEGLEFLHSKKIIHRDIKPQNILLQGNTPRLADFGISRALGASSFSNTVAGTSAYMSPESFNGKRNKQTDIWSIGVVLYQLVNGVLPFPQKNDVEVMLAIIQKEPLPLSKEVPIQLRKIIEKSLTKAPQDRYQQAEEINENLKKFLIELEHPASAQKQLFHSTDLNNSVITEVRLSSKNTIISRTAVIKTNKGTIKFQLLEEDAPKTTENFRLLAERGYYDSVIFHRVIKGFMIQGGDPLGMGYGGESAWGGKFEDEINRNSELYSGAYTKGTVAMANAGPNTNGSQFFIMQADYPLPPAYTKFGRVIEGQDVVDAIAKVQTNQNDKPLDLIVMNSVTIE